MSRRRALVTQADVARAARAARQLGPEWVVEIDGAVIRLVQSPPPDRPPSQRDPEPQFARGLASTP
jgi:hypothetical protein